MARKDDILKSFLEHSLLNEKYSISDTERLYTMSEALHSDNPIIKTLALFVENLEKKPTPTSKVVYELLSKYLNTAIL